MSSRCSSRPAAFAQPGQPAPVQPSLTMQDSNLKPALPGALQGVGIDQKLDQQVPLDLIFRDEAGRAVPLSSFFQTGKPVLLAPVYYRCPMLCTQILNGLASSLKAVSFNPGQDFEIVSVSFDPKDTPELAASKKQMLPEALRPAEHRQRLALPHRRPSQHQGSDGRRGLPLQVRPRHRPVRARQRHHDSDARRPALALLLWRGIRAARRAPGAGGGFAKQDRQPGRPDSAVLLPLRPGHGQVRRRGHEHAARRQRRFRAGLRRVSAHGLAARAARARRAE